MKAFSTSLRNICLLATLSLGAIVLIACANLSVQPFKSLLDLQPSVIETKPTDGSALQDPVEFIVKFSHRVDIDHLDEDSILLLSGKLEPTDLQDYRRLLEKVHSKTIQAMPLEMTLDGEETTLTLRPQFKLPDDIYHLLVTPSLLSVEGVPFNQKPGDKPTPFVAFYSQGEGINFEPGQSVDNSGTPTSTFGPAPQNLVINEFLYDGRDSETDGEAFIELYGTPGADISLYQISWINGADGETTDRITLPVGTLLPEDGIFLIADLRTNSTTTTKVLNEDFLDQFDPQNGPDGVQLLDRNGKLVDSVVYGIGAVSLATNGFTLGEGEAAPDVGPGHSLSRVDGVDTQDNSADFVDLASPTPGVL